VCLIQTHKTKNKYYIGPIGSRQPKHHIGGISLWTAAAAAHSWPMGRRYAPVYKVRGSSLVDYWLLIICLHHQLSVIVISSYWPHQWKRVANRKCFIGGTREVSYNKSD